MNYKETARKIGCVVLVLILIASTITVIANEPDISEGELEYVLSDDLNYYIVSGIGTYKGKDVVIPETYNNTPVREIAEGAFSSCLTMETLYVPATVFRIGQYAFSRCTNLKSATILCSDMGYNPNWSSANAKKCYGYSILKGCSSLENLYIRDVEFEAHLTQVYDYINYYPLGYIFGTLYFSGSVACSQPYLIGDRAEFAYTNFYFPASLKMISLGGYGLESYSGGGYTNPFEGCTSIEKIIIDDGVTWVARGLFKGLNGLDTLVLPDSITEIEAEAFYNSKISNVNYRGTPSQWSQITIGNYNDNLTEKLIFVKFTKTTVSEDGKTFTISPINIENGKTVILALYEDGKFIEMQPAIYEGVAIPFTTTKSYKEARVMVWDNLLTLKPVCDVEIVR